MSAPAPSQLWRLQAACFGEDPAKWDAGDEDLAVRREDGRALWDRAERACRGCPVARECALDAIANGEEHTIRAGVPLGLAERSPRHASLVDSRLRRAAGLGPARDAGRAA